MFAEYQRYNPKKSKFRLLKWLVTGVILIVVILTTVFLRTELRKHSTSKLDSIQDNEAAIMRPVLPDTDLPPTESQRKAAEELQRRMDKILSDPNSPESMAHPTNP